MWEIVLPITLSLVSFLLKALIVVSAIIIVLSFALKEKSDQNIIIKNINKRFKNYRESILAEILEKKEFKKIINSQNKEQKKDKADKPITYVLNFKGDVKASAVDSLRETITAILTVAKSEDEVVLCLESPGGMVHGYGLAASQLQRLKDAQIKLTICVDKVAASGGYMMACLANQIIAAPFAIIGSVGVVASIPNFHKKLKNNNIDYYQITSGKYKRTVSILGEISEDGLEKFKSEIEETHLLFKNHIKKFRPQVDVEKIATGEHWYGEQSLSLNLIDKLGTSDDYLLQQSHYRNIKELEFKIKKTFKEKLAEGLAHLYEKSFDFVANKNNQTFHH